MQEDEILKGRGRKKKLTRETAHNIYIDPDVWEAAGDLPVSRPDIIRQALVNAISFYKNDLPKLKYELSLEVEKLQTSEAKIAVLKSRIEQLEAKAVIEINEQEQKEERLEIAIKETLQMCKAFKKNMGFSHYAKLSELSGIEAPKIEVFLKDSKFRPSEDTLRVLYRCAIEGE